MRDIAAKGAIGGWTTAAGTGPLGRAAASCDKRATTVIFKGFISLTGIIGSAYARPNSYVERHCFNAAKLALYLTGCTFMRLQQAWKCGKYARRRSVQCLAQERPGSESTI